MSRTGGLGPLLGAALARLLPGTLGHEFPSRGDTHNFLFHRTLHAGQPPFGLANPNVVPPLDLVAYALGNRLLAAVDRRGFRTGLGPSR